MNPRAKVAVSQHGQTTIDDLLDIRGFNLNAILEIEPDFLTGVDHEHDDDVTSFVFRETKLLDLDLIEDFLDGVVQVYGTQLMRYKRHTQYQEHGSPCDFSRCAHDHGKLKGVDMETPRTSRN
jgi:G3E family GTPase